MTSEQL